jgi:hypothetical protein
LANVNKKAIMKKISLFISMVLISSVIGGRALGQTTATQAPPVKASDAGPTMATRETIKMPVKNSGGAAATATTARPLSQTELRAVLPLKPGGTAGTVASTGAGANKAIPAGRPGGQPGQPVSQRNEYAKPSTDQERLFGTGDA